MREEEQDEVIRCLRAIADEFREQPWPEIEMYLQVHAELADHLLPELLKSDVRLRRQHGESPTAEDYVRRFPQASETINSALTPDIGATVSLVERDTSQGDCADLGSAHRTRVVDAQRSRGSGCWRVVFSRWTKARGHRLSR